jgi:WD40 repeat protein
MASVFISYAREDRGFVERLHQALKSSDRDAWVDWEGIPPTAEWLNEVHTAIERAGAVIFVLSPDSIASRICRLEMDHAIRNNKRLIPVVRREFGDLDAALPPLAALNWIFFRDTDDFDSAFAALRQAIDTDLDWVHAHTRLLLRVTEWEHKGRERSLLLRGSDLRDAEQWLSSDRPGRDPRLTQLQRDYILGSHRAAKTRRLLLLCLTGLVVAGGGLAVSMILSDRTILTLDSRQLLSRSLVKDAEDLRSKKDFTGAGLLAAETILHQLGPEATDTLCRVLEVLSKSDFSLNHKGIGKSVAYSPDGSLLLTIANGDPVSVWEAATGKPVVELNHPEATGLTLSSDKQRLVTMGTTTVRVWSLPGGHQLSAFNFPDRIIAGTFMPTGAPWIFLISGSSIVGRDALTGAETVRLDTGGRPDIVAFNGTHLATVNSPYQVRVWDAVTGRQLASAEDSGVISGLAFSVPGERLAGISNFTTVTVWEAATGRRQVQIPLTMEPHDLKFSPDGKYLGFATGQGIHLHEIGGSGEQTINIDLLRAWTFSPNGAYIAASDSRNVRLLNASTGSELARTEYKEAVRPAFSPDSQHFAVTGWDNTTRVFKIGPSWSRHVAQIATAKEIESLVIRPDGQQTAVLYSPGQIGLWDSKGNKLDFDHPFAWVKQAVFSPNSKYMATKEDHIAHLFDLATRSRIDIKANYMLSVAFSRDSKSLFVATRDSVKVWDLTAHELTSTSFQPEANSAVFSPGGTLLARLDGGTVKVYEVAGRRQLATAEQPLITDLVFSPSGNMMAMATKSGAKVWRTHGGQAIASLDHTSQVTGMAFNPDEHYLATVGSNGALVWDLNTQHAVVRVAPPVRAVTFSPDGRYLISAGADGTILWSVWQPQDLVDELCRRVFTNMSESTWEDYFGAEPFRKTCPSLP